MIVDDEFFAQHRQEGFKAAVHLAMFGLATAAQLYNLAAYSGRRERHLGVNVAAYTSLAIFEAYQVWRHLQR